jgi:hypothetical protein
VEISGILIQKLPVFNGTGTRGNWVKQEFVLETRESQYPRKVCISVFGDDKVRELASLKTGDPVKVSVNLESREYNGRWYTEVRAWKLEKEAASGAAEPFSVPPPPMEMEPGEGEDDLPF